MGHLIHFPENSISIRRQGPTPYHGLAVHGDGQLAQVHDGQQDDDEPGVSARGPRASLGSSSSTASKRLSATILSKSVTASVAPSTCFDRARECSCSMT
jgi:hypothetical protein